MKTATTIRSLADLEREPRLALFALGLEGGSAKVGVTESIEIRAGREVRYRLTACWRHEEGALPWEALHSIHSLDVEAPPPAGTPRLPLYVRSLYGAEKYLGVVEVVECGAAGLLCRHEDSSRRKSYFFYPWHVVTRLGRVRYASPRFRPPVAPPPEPAPAPEARPLVATAVEAEEDLAGALPPW